MAAVLATVLYLGTAAAVPLLHGSLERGSAPAAVEAGHSDVCPKIHNDSTCPTYAFGLRMTSADSPAPPAGDRARIRPSRSLLAGTARYHGVPPNAVRAPPSLLR